MRYLSCLILCLAACTSTAIKKTIKLGTGIQMAFVEMGPQHGKPVIFLHGLTDTARSWFPLMTELHQIDPSLHLFAPDQRGHGASSMPDGPDCPRLPKSCFTFDLFSNDVVSFMNQMGLDKVILVGHSMGSMVAQEIALKHPELVENLILLGTTGKSKNNPVLRDNVLNEPVLGAWKQRFSTSEAMWNATPRDADPNADEWILKNWIVDPIADQSYINSIAPETATTKLGTWIGATQALLETDNLQALSKLTVPTLVLWGIEDSIFLYTPDQTDLIAVLKKSGARFTWKQYGDSKLPIGHNVHWDKPREVALDLIVEISKPNPLLQTR